MTDLIDQVVDEQMAGGEPLNGYDFGDPDYPRCPHCGRHWHGLPITRHIAVMYALGVYDPEYRYEGDDSPILCAGSAFIGPPRHEPFCLDVIKAREVGTPMAGRGTRYSARGIFQQTLEIFDCITRVGRTMHAGFMFVDQVVLTGQDRPAEQCSSVPDIPIEFGPQNWHYELQRRRVRAEQPLPLPLLARLWAELTSPDVSPRPGYDFGQYVTDDPPPWAPTAGSRGRTRLRPARAVGQRRVDRR